VKDIDKIELTLRSLYRRLQTLYCSKRAENTISNTLEWEKMTQSYCDKEIDEANACPNRKIVQFFAVLANLRSMISSMLNDRSVKPIITSIIEEVALRLGGILLQFTLEILQIFFLMLRCHMEIGTIWRRRSER
jgi:hypothetical protein